MNTQLKRRADNFLVVADSKALGIIQGQVQRYKDEFSKLKSVEDANRLMSLYLNISFDEGYRRVIEELKKEMSYTDHIKAKPRKKDWVEYLDKGETDELYPLIKKRIHSKRQIKAWAKQCEEDGKENIQEHFVLSTVIHTGYEAGYLKAQSIEETAKIVCKDDERAELVLDMFNEIFTSEVMEKLSND